jgi:HEAT repeat protein
VVAKEKVGEVVKEKEGGEGKGRGGGEGEGSGRGAGVAREFVKEFFELSYDEYSNKEISNFFRVLCSLGKGESNQVGKITDGFSNFVREFTRQYGSDALLNHSAKIKKTFQSAPDEIRNKVFLQIIKKGKHVQITMARILLPLMKDETIAGGIINLLKENKRVSLSGFITSLDSKRLSSLNNLLKGKLRKLGWAEKEIEKLWDELTSPSPITSLTGAGAAPEGPTLSSKGHGGISKRAYNRLYKRLKTGMDISEVGSLFQSLYKSLESESPEVKINALETITSVMDEIYAGKKITLVRRMVEELMEYAKGEKNTEVFHKFVEVLSDAGKKAEELNYEFIVKDIISFFAEAVGDNEKAKAIIPHLPNFKLTDARNVLLSLLWNKELRELVIGRIEDLGKESIPYLMELLKDTEEKDVRLALMNAIQSLGSEAIEVVKEYLEDERWYVRRNAVRILGDIGGKEIVSDLYKLHSDDKRVQVELIRSFKRILKVDAESYILEFLESESPEVEKYAVTSLKNIITGKSIPVLNKRLLKDRFHGTLGVEIKIAICDILKGEGGETSLPPLSNIINSTKIFGIPKYPEDLRLAAAMAVASIGGAKAKEILEPLKKDHSKKVRDFVEKII